MRRLEGTAEVQLEWEGLGRGSVVGACLKWPLSNWGLLWLSDCGDSFSSLGGPFGRGGVWRINAFLIKTQSYYYRTTATFSLDPHQLLALE